MDHAAVLALFDRDMREGARPDGPGARIERVGGVVRQVGFENGWSGVVWSDLDEAGADAAITEQIRYFSGLGRDFEWKLYGHDLPVDLGQRLRDAGFTAAPEETLMIAEVADLTLDVEPPEGVRLLPVTDREGVDMVADVHEKAFGTDSTRLRHQLLAQLTGDTESVVAVVALAGDEPVSAARMELLPGTRFAYLWVAAPSRAGAVAVSTGPSSPIAPASPPTAATATSRSTRWPSAARSWPAWASSRSRRRRRTSTRSGARRSDRRRRHRGSLGRPGGRAPVRHRSSWYSIAVCVGR